jgi:hypothetical protein
MEVRFRRCRLYYDISWAAVTNGLETQASTSPTVGLDAGTSASASTNGLETQVTLTS